MIAPAAPYNNADLNPPGSLSAYETHLEAFDHPPCALLALVAATARADDWPEFRGPTGQGHYTGKPLPLHWSTTRNVVWKQPIPGKGWSSPIVQDGRIYLTTAVPVAGSKDQSLQALCLDAATGKQLWQREVFRQDGKKAPAIHRKNSHASPTPLTDGKRLYVHFGHQGTACLDLDGNVRWRIHQGALRPSARQRRHADSRRRSPHLRHRRVRQAARRRPRLRERRSGVEDRPPLHVLQEVLVRHAAGDHGQRQGTSRQPR